jgi:hypothetical protein
VKLWDVASGRLLVSLLSLPSQDEKPAWLALTPEGYVEASQELAVPFEWRMSGQRVGGDTDLKSLRQPEMIARALRGEAVPAPTFGK